MVYLERPGIFLEPALSGAVKVIEGWLLRLRRVIFSAFPRSFYAMQCEISWLLRACQFSSKLEIKQAWRSHDSVYDLPSETRTGWLPGKLEDTGRK
jgi:hypothetical protein